MVLAFTWLCLPTANWGKNTYSFTVLNSVSFQCPLWWSPRVVNTLLPNSQKPLDIPLAIFATVRKQTFVHSEILTYWDTQSWGSSGNPMGVGVAGWFCGSPNFLLCQACPTGALSPEDIVSTGLCLPSMETQGTAGSRGQRERTYVKPSWWPRGRIRNQNLPWEAVKQRVKRSKW